MADELPEPASRKEQYLAKAAGMDVDELPEPASREEQYLNAIAEGGGGGGGGVTPVQTTGTSTTDVMSQNATTKMIYPDIANYPYKMVIGEGSIDGSNKGTAINGVIGSGLSSGSIAIGVSDGNFAQVGQNGRATGSVAIGSSASVGRGNQSVCIGFNAYCNSGQDAGDNVAIGYNSYAGNGNATGTVALGARSKPTRQGEVNVGNTGNGGFNNTAYRVIGGVHDGQDAHDAVTVGQLNTRMGGMTILSITQAAYDALATKDPNTLYVITGA